MLEFVTAAEEAVAPEEDITTPIHFYKMVKTNVGTDEEPRWVEEKVLDHTITAHRPEPGQFAILTAALVGRGTSEDQQIAGIIDFFVDLLDEEDKQYVSRRLMDRKDPFSQQGMEFIQNALEALVSEWSGRPTKSLSGSAQSPGSDGQKSTPTTPPLTSSDSPFTSS